MKKNKPTRKPPRATSSRGDSSHGRGGADPPASGLLLAILAVSLAGLWVCAFHARVVVAAIDTVMSPFDSVISSVSSNSHHERVIVPVQEKAEIFIRLPGDEKIYRLSR